MGERGVWRAKGFSDGMYERLKRWKKMNMSRKRRVDR